ncbi:MAG: DinB family protein [Candidatus Heimdallarchaeota archaeon]|nr:DinB family protein [Candidatus Heimdallarchaeota archaeon]
MRRLGTMGALMDEYERALNELILIATPATQDLFETILDAETTDEDCRSMQTIMTHVLRAGYAYSAYIRTAFKMDAMDRSQIMKEAITMTTDIDQQLRQMFVYMLETVKEMMHMPENEFGSHRIPVRWDQDYDLEQLLEHAIVHLLRHRRQIEYFYTLAA